MKCESKLANQRHVAETGQSETRGRNWPIRDTWQKLANQRHVAEIGQSETRGRNWPIRDTWQKLANQRHVAETGQSETRGRNWPIRDTWQELANQRHVAETSQSETRSRNWPIPISAAYLEEDQSGQSGVGGIFKNYGDLPIFQGLNFYLCISVVYDVFLIFGHIIDRQRSTAPIPPYLPWYKMRQAHIKKMNPFAAMW